MRATTGFDLAAGARAALAGVDTSWAKPKHSQSILFPANAGISYGAPLFAAAPSPSIETKCVPYPPVFSQQIVALGANILVPLIVMLALIGCGRKTDQPQPRPTPVSSGSASSALTPIPASSTARVIPPQTAPPFPASNSANPGLTSDLAGALANAAPGATIQLPPGIYPGGLVLTKAVRIVGSMGQVFIQSEGRECISVRSAGVAVLNVQFICNGIGQLPAISVAEGAALELDGCKITSNTELGVTAVGKASIKAIGTSFVAVTGKAMRLDRQARGNFTQCSFAQSQLGLELANGASAELHSCAFDANGGNEGDGSIAYAGDGATFTADDCYFTNNNSGVTAAEGGTLTISHSSFKGNGIAPRDGVALALVTVATGGRGRITNTTFETNRQGLLIAGTAEIENCQFTGNGTQDNHFKANAQTILVFGKGAVATLRHCVLKGSEQYATFALASAKLIMDDVEISDSNTSGLVVGDRSLGAATAEVRSCRFLQNGLGMGVFAGSFASLEGCEFRGNEDGIIVLDQGSRLKGNKLTLAANKDCGINVRNSAQATVTNSDIQGNARGAVSGTRGKAAERGSLTLEDCHFAGNRTYAAGACAQSELILIRCVFDGSDKTNVFKERGAMVQNDAIPPPAPVPQPTAAQGPEKPVPAPEVGDDLLLPNEQTEDTSSPKSTTSPSPHHEKRSSKPRRKSTPRPHPPTPEGMRRLLRRLLPGG